MHQHGAYMMHAISHELTFHTCGTGLTLLFELPYLIIAFVFRFPSSTEWRAHGEQQPDTSRVSHDDDDDDDHVFCRRNFVRWALSREATSVDHVPPPKKKMIQINENKRHQYSN